MRGKLLSMKKSGVVLSVVLLIALTALGACSSGQQSNDVASSSAERSSFSSTPSEQLMTVPNVVSLTQADAQTSIVSSGFVMGKATTENSDTVPLGNVISQSPEPLSTAQRGTEVNIVVSAGKAKPKKVKVPDLSGMNQDDAKQALKDAGLVAVTPDTEETAEFTPGLVFKQSVDPGKSVKEGTRVRFTIAVAPTTATVPDVIGMGEGDAETTIANASLGFDVTRTYSAEYDEGVVMSQSIASGVVVQVGTTVSICVSLGPVPVETVTVPDVLSYTWSDAETALESAGLLARYTGDVTGIVVDQDYDPGTTVDEDTVVTVTLGRSPQTVTVPDLIGMQVGYAEVETDQLGLALDCDGTIHGTITDQWPDPGTDVELGTTVSVTVDDSDFR